MIRLNVRAPFALKPEVIGPTDCPVLHRWTLGSDRLMKNAPVKVLLHHFQPHADDRDTHDHPRPFVTVVLRGGYEDWVLCPDCQTRAAGVLNEEVRCPRCSGYYGMVLGDRMRAGTVRFRRATHAHRTRVGPRGCWTLVVMGPSVRRWGFWREGAWWSFRDYERHFGFAFRCDADDERLPISARNRDAGTP